MSDQTPGSGFDPHVWGQLNNAATQGSQRSRGPPYGRGRANRQNFQPRLSQPQYAATLSPAFQSPPPPMDSFPPLGAQQPHIATTASSSPLTSPVSPQSFSRPQPRVNTYSRPYRGNFNGPNQPHYGHAQQYSQPPVQPFNQPHDEYRRPAAPGGQLYQPASAPQHRAGPYQTFDEKEKVFRKQVMAQSDYLNQVQAATRQKYQLKQDESLQKEAFRRKLEGIFQTLLLAKYPATVLEDIRLRCYGSLNNGFGLANCDMDLLLSLPEELDLINKAIIDSEQPNTILDSPQQTDQYSAPQPVVSAAEEDDDAKFEIALLLEGALLDLGIGARLLTKTRVPILRVCERPSAELLQNLRDYRKEGLEAAAIVKERVAEGSQTPPELNVSEISTALQDLVEESSAASVSLPASPPKTKQANLEFTGDCGIQCDINFTNFVAIHNTRLLREYCQYDSRVAEVGTFVKSWAKIRDINTPYLGTLSSYGYVLMVLHYLMNIVQPPVIPNLQHLAKAEASWNSQPAEKFDGKFDIRFWNGTAKIQELKTQLPRNRESTGHLLRGFFWYYSAREGFNFKNDIISIRMPGGLLKKHNKGWTEAKWSDNKKNVRQRYLLAIEDPFETEHNIARVVGHNGIVAIRDEFRRAWTIISSIGGANPSTESLLEPMESRGDLLRKDQDHHRERIRKMKQELEAKEKQALNVASASNGEVGVVASDGLPEGVPQEYQKQENGTFTLERRSPSPNPSPISNHKSSPPRRSPNSKLTSDYCVSQVKSRRAKNGLVRRVKEESDDEDETQDSSKTRKVQSSKDDKAEVKVPVALNEAANDEEEPFISNLEYCLSQGYDEEGNPVAWDVTTQDGRWLQWRDNKIRKGTWRGTKPTKPSLADHDRKYPYDPRRPKADTTEYILANSLFYVNQAPYPMNKVPEITSTESAIAARISKYEYYREKEQQAKKHNTADPSNSVDAFEKDPVQAALNAVTRNLNAADIKARSRGGKQSSRVQGRDFLKSRRKRRVADDPEEPSRDGRIVEASIADDQYGQSTCATSWKDPEHWVNTSADPVSQVDRWTDEDERGASEPEPWGAVGKGGMAEESNTAEPWAAQQPETAIEAEVKFPVVDRGQTTSINERPLTRDSAVSALTNPYPDDPQDPFATVQPSPNATTTIWPSPRRNCLHTAPHAGPRTYSDNDQFRQPGPSYATASMMSKRSDNDPVGLPINWDKTTAGGRWLRERDNWVRLGRFHTPRNVVLRALHEQFPYDSTMPIWKLRLCNLQLRTHYQHSLGPVYTETSGYAGLNNSHAFSGFGGTQISRPIEHSQVAKQESEAQWRQYSQSELPLPTLKAAQIATSDLPTLATSETEQLASNLDQTEAMPDSAFIRARRLAFFAVKERSESIGSQESKHKAFTDITGYMERAGIINQDGHRNTYQPLEQVPLRMPTQNQKMALPITGSTTTSEHQFLASSYESKIETEVMEQESSAGPETVKVPLTLYPNMSGDERPRDEDPRIMPIPRKLGYKFDVRHLRDLAVIREGGNGCARGGYEFEIIDERNFTGSDEIDGMSMAQEYGEGVEAAEDEDEDADDDEIPYEYEMGMGETMDLLEELPGPDI